MRLRSVLAGLLLVGLLAGPLVYTWPMLGGLAGQLTPTAYPDGWAEANDHLVDDDSEYRVVALPWHQYLAFPWTVGTVATPADAYFQRPVVRSRVIDLAGIEAQTGSPTHERVSAILVESAGPSPVGPELAPLGVKYVVVLSAADYRTYDWLHDDGSMAVVVENDDLVLFENRAFDRSPPPTDWPRAWPPVPRIPLAVGAAVTWISAVGGTVRPVAAHRWVGRWTGAWSGRPPG